MRHGVFCFRNDLRLHDQPALTKALQESDVLDLVYFFDPKIWNSGYPRRISTHRANFILECLDALRQEIEKRGGFLMIKHNAPVEALPRLMERLGATHCYMEAHSSADDVWEEKELSNLIELELEEGSTLVHPEDVSFSHNGFPETFTKFRKQVEKNFSPRPCIPPPIQFHCSIKQSDPIPPLAQFSMQAPEREKRSPFTFEGGENAAQQRISHWMFKEGHLGKYKETRNGLIGHEFSSRLSPWLAQGCISPRQVYENIRKYESEREANQSTYWLIFELLWRDFFYYLSRYHGSKIFLAKGIHPERPARENNSNQLDILLTWKQGKTNDAFVNANMNELRLTGWMSNRGRQNTASYLINELGVAWRLGAQWFEEMLIDYDPCNNYGNWLYLSGYGSDPRPNRMFNLQKQAATYDPNFEYRNLWS
jgi:deoxyribodipyrimidine photo-lyase